jgi:hypothetical protein
MASIPHVTEPTPNAKKTILNSAALNLACALWAGPFTSPELKLL